MRGAGSELSSGLLQTPLISQVLTIVAVLVALLALATFFLTARPLPLIAIYAAVFTATGIGLWLARSGRPHWGAVGFICTGWLAITISAVFFGGAHSPSYFAYVALVMVTGLVWSERAALVFGVLSTAVATALVLVPDSLLPASPMEVSGGRLWVAFIAEMAVVLLTLRNATRSIRQSLITAALNTQLAIEAKQASERRVRQQAAIARLGQRALASRDLAGLLDECVQAAAGALDADFAKVLELSPDGSSLLLRAGVGWQPGLVGSARVPNDLGSQAGFTVASKLPVITSDLLHETRFTAPELLSMHGVRSGISVPIVVEGQCFGILAAHSRTPGFFRDEDAVFLQTATNLLSAALARERLEARLARSDKLEALGRLAGGVAHDFNNLLTVILGYADGMAEGVGAFPPALAGKEIREAAERAAALTGDLLAFTRREPSAPRTVDLNQVAAASARMLERLIGEHVRLELKLSEEVSPIRADPNQIDRILVNLVVNARDALDQGGLIVIETQKPSANPEIVRLVVRDTGKGMTASVLEHAFEPFFSTKGSGGSGLGLSTVHGLVNQLGGEIRVASAPGAGTRFEIDLPRAKEEHAVAPDSAPDSVDAQGRSGKTILLAEDDDPLRALVRESLVRDGYLVLEARDGRVALEIVQNHRGPIDALVSDIVMPDAGGFELVAGLRKARPGTPVIYMSGYVGNERAFAEIERGEAAFLPKPFRVRDLSAALERVLGVRPGR